MSDAKEDAYIKGRLDGLRVAESFISEVREKLIGNKKLSEEHIEIAKFVMEELESKLKEAYTNPKIISAPSDFIQ